MSIGVRVRVMLDHQFFNEPVYFVESHLRVDAWNLPTIESNCLYLHLRCVSYIPGARRASGMKSTNVSLAFQTNRIGFVSAAHPFSAKNGMDSFINLVPPNNQIPKCMETPFQQEKTWFLTSSNSTKKYKHSIKCINLNIPSINLIHGSIIQLSGNPKLLNVSSYQGNFGFGWNQVRNDPKSWGVSSASSLPGVGLWRVNKSRWPNSGGLVDLRK